MSIIISTSKIKAFQFFYDLCEFCGYEKSWTDSLWSDIVQDDALFNELVYYFDNHTFLDEFKVKGYSLSDLYVFQMSKYNLIREIGKNPVECNKERMVMNSFRMMIDMARDPETYVARIEEGKGNDRL